MVNSQPLEEYPRKKHDNPIKSRWATRKALALTTKSDAKFQHMSIKAYGIKSENKYTTHIHIGKWKLITSI